MNYRRYNIEFHVQAPVLTGTSDVLPAGADVIAEQFHGKPVLPGSLIRGVLRHAWTELRELGADFPVDDWLGKESVSSDGNAAGEPTTFESANLPCRRILRFSHVFNLEGDRHSPETLIRIAINEDTGAVKDKAMQHIESQWAMGEIVTVQGWVEAPVVVDEHLLKRALQEGIEWAGAVGMSKGIGFGRIIYNPIGSEEPVPAVAVTVENAIAQVVSTNETEEEFWMIELDFDRPVCFAEPHGDEANRFVSKTSVPGAALIAVISQSGVLDREALNQLSVSHGIQTGCVPACPLSFVKMTQKADEKKYSCETTFYADASAYEGPFVVESPDGVFVVPRFPADWKDDLPGTTFPQPPNHLQIRNAIANNSRVTDNGKLFSMLSIDLPTSNKAAWQFEVDVSQIGPEKRQALAHWLTSSSIGPFGKTGAIASNLAIKPTAKPRIDVSGSVLRLMLTTDACVLGRPFDNDRRALEAYAEYWNTISSGALELKDLFIKETLVGGQYIHRRFRTGEHYEPDIMTLAGSVFVLVFEEKDRERVQNQVNTWRLLGLPDALHYSHYELDEPHTAFQRRPWSPRNGFGRIDTIPEPPNPLPLKVTGSDSTHSWRLHYV